MVKSRHDVKNWRARGGAQLGAKIYETLPRSTVSELGDRIIGVVCYINQL